ncbi:hypothetical protein DXG03_008353 [Asterophora parasitica]|uniref:F-box domain-containing protein n=1 Tax=Asterophora parasitica TaxID=117018 RepID=A0A9P7G5W6_9AGAR|nr:hypothetical protein DXG03_008353 [Asterophora parasitica]
MVDHDQSLSSLQVNMNKLLEEMKTINIKRLNNIDTVNFYRSLLSPIRLLPPELLGQIFLYAVQSHAPVRRGSPLSFTLVCSAWRQAALGCSYLWNELELSPGHPVHYGLNTLCPQRFSAFFSSWFRRANPAQPFRLSLNFDSTAPKLEREFANQLCRSVGSISPRLSELSIEFTHGTYNVLLPFLSNDSADLAALEVLSLMDYSSTWRLEEVFPPVKVFGYAPRLCNVSLRIKENILVDSSSKFSPPWSQLTTVDIRGTLSLGDFVLVIFQCPQLRVGYFMQVNIGDRINDANIGQLSLPDTAMSLPCLVDFKLQFSGDLQLEPVDSTFVDVLRLIKLPVVERLNVASDPSCKVPLTPIFFNTLTEEAMHQTLRSLSLSNVDADLNELLDCVANCTVLEELSLCMSGTPTTTILQNLLLFAQAPSHSSDEYPKPMSYLRVFRLAFLYIDNPDYMAIGLLFGQVVAALIKDSRRHRPLESASLYVCDYHRSSLSQEQLESLTVAVESHVRDAEGGGAAASRGIDLEVKAFTSYSELSVTFDLLDLDEPLRRLSRLRN